MKVAASPFSLFTNSVPPCPCLTMSYESDKPSPVPERVGFVVKNGSKIFSYMDKALRGSTYGSY